MYRWLYLYGVDCAKDATVFTLACESANFSCADRKWSIFRIATFLKTVGSRVRMVSNY
jgi:hypothetical protein